MIQSTTDFDCKVITTSCSRMFAKEQQESCGKEIASPCQSPLLVFENSLPPVCAPHNKNKLRSYVCMDLWTYLRRKIPTHFEMVGNLKVSPRRNYFLCTQDIFNFFNQICMYYVGIFNKRSTYVCTNDRKFESLTAQILNSFTRVF